MEKDVVCGMQVDPKKAAGKSEHQGKSYYFCSPVCKKKFDAAPEQYTKNPMFYWKIAFVVLGAINILYFMLLEEPWNVKAGDDAPKGAVRQSVGQQRAGESERRRLDADATSRRERL